VITPDDVEFHTPDDPHDPTWAETNYFGFYNAELHTNIGLYTIFRPNLGVVMSTISINSGQARQPWLADFFDHQAHLAIPEDGRLSDFTLANGLSITCHEPNMKWHLGYDDGQGTVVDVEYTSLMQPFDIHDPDQDPIVAAQQAAASGTFAWGTAYNGHFDQTGHFVGHVDVRGKRIPIDCVSTMDHSWGPRKERGAPNMSWFHAHFGTDYALHSIWSFDHTGGTDELTLAHGYVLKDGEVRGLAAGTGRTVRDADHYARQVEVEVSDANGRSYAFTGEGLTRFPWQFVPNTVGFNVLARWQSDGRTGHGEIQDFVDVTTLTELTEAERSRATAGSA